MVRRRFPKRWVLRVLTLIAVVLLAAACSSEEEVDSVGSDQVEGAVSLYRPGNRFGWGGKDAFLDNVMPVFAKRCASCHGCTNSPCQLKLTSYEGIARGSNPENLFSSHVLASQPTRMKDARSEEEWRKKGFYSVTSGAENSIMYRMLQTGRAFNEPGFDLAEPFSVAKENLSTREFQCVGNADKLEIRLAEKPHAAMPLGLSRLPEEEFRVLADWLKAGGPGPSQEAQSILAAPRNKDVVAKWETFLNQRGAKEQLSMRYIYEHTAFAKLHFEESRGDFFEIVRSRTAAPNPIDEIVTETVSGDPKGEFHYRLKKVTAVVLDKDNVVWSLDDQVMRQWRELFLESDWGPSPIPAPSYDSDNPFEYFDRIPSTIRYEFMLKNALDLVSGLVKGDVCNGSTATYAIRDRFWMWFLKPSADPSALNPKLGNATYVHLDPTSANPVREIQYAELFEKGVRELRPNGFSMQDIWDGDGGKDKNAWITVMRHGKSATAHQGAVGGLPETMWVLSYANFERLFYILVVNYKNWGGINHKLVSWNYMSHIRSDAEDLFLSFLPEPARQPLRDRWIQGFGRVSNFLYPLKSEGRRSQVVVGNAEPLRDFAALVRDRLGPTISGPIDPMNPMPGTPAAAIPTTIKTQADFERGLATLTGVPSELAKAIPNTVVLSVVSATDAPTSPGWIYTLIGNRGYAYHNRVVAENLARDPSQDTVSAARGIIGTYPESFMKISLADAPAFLAELKNVRSPADWIKIKDKREIPRNAPEFWDFLDGLHRYSLRENPIEAGLLDVSEYGFPSKFGRLD